jgi:hypothetical protein
MASTARSGPQAPEMRSGVALKPGGNVKKKPGKPAKSSYDFALGDTSIIHRVDGKGRGKS